MTGKAVYSVLFSETHVQVYVEFPQGLVSHDQRYVHDNGVYHYTFKKCQITQTMYSFAYD